MQTELRFRQKMYPVFLTADDRKIYFVKSAYGLKDFIKAMRGSRWNPDQRIWTVSKCAANMFNLRYAMGENVFAHFQQELVDLDITRPLMPQQVDMLRRWQTYRYQIAAADAGLGKSLTALEMIERNPGNILLVGPKSALESVAHEKLKWNSTALYSPMTYQRFRIDYQEYLENPPRGIIFDECTEAKNPGSQTAQAAQAVTDRIREVHGMDGFVILMSGTTTAKAPTDLWSPASIAWPGYTAEGSFKAFQERYAVMELVEDSSGIVYQKRTGWREEEVAMLPERLKGLVTTYFKSDYLSLPPRTFQVIKLEVTAKLKRIAKALMDAAPNTISGLTWLRALSSGFQYDETGDERTLVETKCPKDDALRQILDEDEPNGRVVLFASFQGSIDRVQTICQEKGWMVARIDGRGWKVFDVDGQELHGETVLGAWANRGEKMALVGNPASCRFGLTLVEAKTVCYFDQGFSAEHRLQSMDRIYRIGQTDPTRVVDLVHLPVDQLILDVLKDNGKMEDLSLGRIREALEE